MSFPRTCKFHTFPAMETKGISYLKEVWEIEMPNQKVIIMSENREICF
jgi:hypothetical protein